MDDIDPRGLVIAILTIIALLIGLRTYNGLMTGEISLSDALTPSWVGFANTNPFLFTLIALVGTLILGRVFVSFLENI